MSGETVKRSRYAYKPVGRPLSELPSMVRRRDSLLQRLIEIWGDTPDGHWIELDTDGQDVHVARTSIDRYRKAGVVVKTRNGRMYMQIADKARALAAAGK